MRSRIAGALVGLVLVGLPACGGADGEPLLSGSFTGDWNGETFTAINGFAALYNDAPWIGIGDGPIHCGTESSPTPPDGDNVVIYPPAFDVGDYANVLVQLHHNVGDYEGYGTNQGTLTITAASDASIAGTLDYLATDTSGRHFAASGTFEVVRCAP